MRLASGLCDRAVHQPGQFLDVFRRSVGQVSIFGMVPDLLHRVEFRRMAGQPFHLKAAAGPLQQSAHRGPMHAPAIQDEEEALRLAAAQCSQEDHHLLRANVVSVRLPTQAQAVPLRRYADGAYHRQPIPLAQPRRVPSGRPSPSHHRLQHEAAFVHEADATTLAARLFLYAASAVAATAGSALRLPPPPAVPASARSSRRPARSSRRGPGDSLSRSWSRSAAPPGPGSKAGWHDHGLVAPPTATATSALSAAPTAAPVVRVEPLPPKPESRPLPPPPSSGLPKKVTSPLAAPPRALPGLCATARPLGVAEPPTARHC